MATRRTDRVSACYGVSQYEFWALLEGHAPSECNPRAISIAPGATSVVSATPTRTPSRARAPGGLVRGPFGAPSAELFGQSDDDALGAADVAEPIDVLVLRQLADEFGAVGAQARNDVINVVDGEHD